MINDRWNPYEIVACAPNRKGHFTSPPPAGIPTLRSYQDVSLLCERGLVDIVILADGRRADEDVFELARECEKKMVDFMVIPSGFQILLSCLELNTISGVPLLGVTKLPLNNPFNWALKRAIDIVGSLVGLILSAPIIALYALLVYLESPGPVFYRQLRVGRRGRHFYILKIRSMKLDAEHASGPRWATRFDERTLKIGAFMRRWNIDELPQFWNVLKGDLSLVGPRPERPELIKRFREEVLYYNARHNIIPGMTGWAQVNGFRGDTDLSERIRCDIYYIENWNPTSGHSDHVDDLLSLGRSALIARSLLASSRTTSCIFADITERAQRNCCVGDSRLSYCNSEFTPLFAEWSETSLTL